MGERFTISAEVLIQLIERGSTDATQAAIRDINIQQTQNIQINQAATRSSQQYGYSLRRVALDLRMMAIGLRILRDEYGGISPVIDIAIGGLYQFSAAGAVLIGGFGIISRGLEAFRKTAGDATTNMEALSNVFTYTAGGVYVAAAAMGVLAAIGIGQYAYAQISGIAALRREIKALEEGMKATQSEMRNLGVEESILNAQSSALTAQINALKLEIERQGEPTESQTARLKSLEASLADVGVSMGWARAESAMYRSDLVKDTDQVEDFKEMIEEANQAAVRGVFGPSRGPQGSLSGRFATIPPEGQMGGEVRKRGAVSVEPGEIIMQREQVALMMTGRGGAGDGPISVTISLAGANITGVQDLEGTLRRGGEAAREEIRRLNLLRRRGRSRF